MTLPRLLCVMGSGETAPTMVSVHGDLLARLGDGASAALIDTPFGFQENADDLVARIREYFRHNVGHDIELASLRNSQAISDVDREVCSARLAEAAYVFAGPGSPTYALGQWRDSAIPDLLRAKLRGGGCVTFASAAAVSLGAVAIPVYEIYKVGQPPHWLEGLDLIAELGIRAAVVPHFNNAEGAGHDTRFCYMGERRLRLLESMMPEDTAILGVDEHTALIVDLTDGRVQVRGRGRLTVRRRDAEMSWDHGSEMALDDLRAATQGTATGASALTREATANLPAAVADTPLSELMDEHRRQFDSAVAARDVPSMVAALLALDTTLVEWQGDSLGSDERDRGRALLRRSIAGLGELARDGGGDPRRRLSPLVDAMLELRQRAREERRFSDADGIRDALIRGGVEIRDSGAGTDWSVRPD